MCRKLFYLLTLVLVLGLTSNASATLVGNWKLDDNAANPTVVASMGPNGTFSDATGNPNTDFHSVTGRTGALNTALNFDGADDYVDCTNSAAFDMTTGLTMSAWVKNEPYGQAWIASKMGAGAGSYGMFINPATGNTLVFGANIGGWGDSAPSNTAIPGGVWTHVAVTYDGTDIKYYLNGVPDGVVNRPGSITTQTGSFTIGFEAGWSSQRMGGDLEDVGLWDVALHPNDIQNIYHSGVPEPATIALLGLGGVALFRRRRAER